MRREPAAAAAVAPAPSVAEAVPALPLQPTAAADAPVGTPPTPGGIRTGSPFAPDAVMAPVATHLTVGAGVALAPKNRPKPPPTNDLIRDQVAIAGGIASIVLGGFALAVSWMSSPTAVIGGALIAVLGLLMGMWGLHSRRRGWALFGMLICVGAIALASFSGAMQIYESRLEEQEADVQIVDPGY